MKGFIKWFFNFGAKYRKREEEYHRRSKKFGNSGELFGFVIYVAVPLLALWGAFALPWSIWKVFCIIGSCTIYLSATEMMITGIVAFRHALRMKVQNKIEDEAAIAIAETITGKEATEEERQKVSERQAKGTAYKYDMAVGITGITLSVLVTIAFITMFLLFARGAIIAASNSLITYYL